MTVAVLANDVDPDGPNDGPSIASLGSVSPAGGASAAVSGKSVRSPRVAPPAPSRFPTRW
ncbi:MAG: hypothetical protein R2713_06645 [Ilumatobacteraceae bacterium]